MAYDVCNNLQYDDNIDDSKAASGGGNNCVSLAIPVIVGTFNYVVATEATRDIHNSS
jgi:hypothetical protein